MKNWFVKSDMDTSTFSEPAKSLLLKNDEDGIALKVTANNETQIVKLLGGKGTNNAFKQVKIGELDFAIKYGSKVLELPFSIKLNDFIAERYPGTENSYSSFASEVTLIDPQNGVRKDHRIFMNNVLDYGGYRFFQSSYDQDEKGTVLSVNSDFWGTWITYIGYFMLFFGLMAIMFTKHSRFADLKRKLEVVKSKKSKLITILLLLLSFNSYSQHQKENLTVKQIDSLLLTTSTCRVVCWLIVNCLGAGSGAPWRP